MFGQRIQLWWDLPLLESFELLRHIYRVPATRHRQNLARFRELLELDPFLQTPVRQLSLGQRIRGELTAAMQWLRFRGPAAELTSRVAAQARLVDLQIAEPDIEEIVRRIYRS